MVNNFIVEYNWAIVVNGIMKIEQGKWASYLRIYFKMDSDPKETEEEENTDASEEGSSTSSHPKKADLTPKENAWELFRTGILCNDMNAFQAFLSSEDNWMPVGSGDRLLTLGRRLAFIYNGLA
ncbi:hypothetical protein SUGI_1048550 [Cryptomeria japonica]|nr:hypothetical protein SUGI_1048550 [Cryptomeria japonica]